MIISLAALLFLLAAILGGISLLVRPIGRILEIMLTIVSLGLALLAGLPS